MKYVYMIDYINWLHLETDQVECFTQDEVLEEIKYLKEKSDARIINVKLVEDKNREHEEEISYTLGQEIVRLLGYKPMFMNTRNKGERL